jgi:predicted dehydrogenase
MRHADPPSVVLVGAHGYGRTHLRNLARLDAARRVRLAGVADPRPSDAEQRTLIGDAPHAADAAALIGAVRPAVVVLATPVHTHVDLTLLAFRSGAHVLLEKPPTPTLDGLDQLLAAQRRAGVACQVGFQALGSGAFDELSRLIDRQALGEVRRIGVTGLWSRDAAYWTRTPWAGRRTLDGQPVGDGALTNPFAHGVALALRLDGSAGHEPIRAVELETYRTRPVQAHDTASARIETARGTPVTVAVTLCADPPGEPVIEVFGSTGYARLRYTEDRLGTAAGWSGSPRVDLLENLLDHLADPGVPLRAPLADTRGFTQVVEAVRLGPEPTPVAERELIGLADVVRRAVAGGLLFSELDATWATAQPFRWTP